MTDVNPGDAVVDLRGGTLSAAGILNKGIIRLSDATLAVAPSVGVFIGDSNDHDARLEASGAPSTVSGNVVNNGTVKVTDTTLSFVNGTFTNNGAYLSDPSDNFFEDLVVGRDGYLVGGAGDRFFIDGDFLNSSREPLLWDTADAFLGFTGAGDHEFRLADVLQPGDFGWGTLALLDGGTLALTGGAGASLYLDELVLAAGTTLDLGGYEVFVRSFTDQGGSLRNGELTFLGGTGGGGPAPGVPAPATPALVAIGVLVSLARRAWRDGGGRDSGPLCA